MPESGFVPAYAPWYAAFRSELLSFPAAKHDDQVDALGLIGQLLDRMVAGTAPEKTNELPRDAYREFGERRDDSVLTM
jgi:hypothetical protein